jgi:DNA polymerase I-like protein with 3'-5' exonuclease and polymerase domains
MIRAFEDKMDVHSLTGSLISGLPYEEVRRQDEDGIYCPIGGGLYTWRFWGKKANHGLNYDLGYRTFAFYYEIPERDAQYIVERYHQAYPGVRQYHTWVRSKLSQGRVLENCLGRKRLFLGRWGDELFKEAYSFIPQSSIADKLNQHGLLPLYYDPQFAEVDILNQVHDSLVFQIPLSLPIEEHARILFSLKHSLERPMTWEGREFVIPADIEFTVEGNLGKYKAPKDDKPGNPLGLRKFEGGCEEDFMKEVGLLIEQTRTCEVYDD